MPCALSCCVSEIFSVLLVRCSVFRSVVDRAFREMQHGIASLNPGFEHPDFPKVLQDQLKAHRYCCVVSGNAEVAIELRMHPYFLRYMVLVARLYLLFSEDLWLLCAMLHADA